jgi:hypothetical protein
MVLVGEVKEATTLVIGFVSLLESARFKSCILPDVIINAFPLLVVAFNTDCGGVGEITNPIGILETC